MNAFMGQSEAEKGTKPRSLWRSRLIMMILLLLPRTSCPAGQATIGYGGAWSPEMAHRRQGARQSSQGSVAVYWLCVARFWGGYQGEIL